MNKVNLPEGVTKEMVEAWKVKHGADKIQLAHLVDRNGAYLRSVVVRVPDRTVLGEQEKYGFSNPMKAKEILVKNCVLSHNEEVLADDQLFYSAYAALVELSPLAKATVEPL